VNISSSQLSKALRKKNFHWRRPRHTLKRRQTASEVDWIGLRLQLRKRQAEAGDIVLLYGLRWILDSTVWWAEVGRTADIANVTQFPLSEILP
jgi:hypothetical protein